MLYIILFGPPGSGKGTQSEKIIEKYNLVHISTGDLLRNPTDGGAELGKLVQEYVDSGNLAPDELVIRMVEMKIKANTKAKGFIFDGFPRTVAQAKALDEMLEKRNVEITTMLALEVDDEEIRTRIHLRGKTSGRADDQDDEKINNRIKVYKEETLPVANYYSEKSKFQGINGVGDVDGIFDDICMSIDLVKITS